MDFKEVKGVKHFLYDSVTEFRVHHPDEPLIQDWRSGKTNDWVLTDDDNVVQILKMYDIKIQGSKRITQCIRCVLGTYRIDNMNAKLLGSEGIAQNIYTFSRTYKAYNEYRKAGLKPKEFVFARYVAEGMEITQAYKKVFKKSKSSEHIANSAKQLMKKDEVKKMVKEEIKKVLQDEGITPDWILSRYKDIAELADKDADKLRSLESLSKIAGLFNTDTKQEQLTVWAGFSEEQMEALKSGEKAELIAHKEE